MCWPWLMLPDCWQWRKEMDLVRASPELTSHWSLGASFPVQSDLAPDLSALCSGADQEFSMGWEMWVRVMVQLKCWKLWKIFLFLSSFSIIIIHSQMIRSFMTFAEYVKTLQIVDPNQVCFLNIADFLTCVSSALCPCSAFQYSRWRIYYILLQCQHNQI